MASSSETIDLINSMDDLIINNASVETSSVAKEERKIVIERCLIHALNCKNVNCTLLSCKRMKQLIVHFRACEKLNCVICKQFIALCCYHAKICNEIECKVPYCVTFKNKLEQRKMKQNN